MRILNKFNLGDTVSFELRVGAILAQVFDNVVVEGVIPASLCDTVGLDAYATHAQVYPLLPKGIVENNAESYQYLVLKGTDGTRRAIGIPWINPETIKVHKTQVATFIVPNIAQEDVERIRDVINRYGYSCTFELI